MEGDRSIIIDYDITEDRIMIYDGYVAETEEEMKAAVAEGLSRENDPVKDIKILTKALGVMMRAAESAGVQPASTTMRDIKNDLDEMFADVNFNARLVDQSKVKW